MQTTTTTGKPKTGVVGKSGLKRMNKKKASEWFQNLSLSEKLLLKQKANSSSEERKTKKERHERERDLILKIRTRSPHESPVAI